MIQRHHLEILMALHEKGTLGEAASHLCLTQSALSHSMHKLEEQSGARLWSKQGRRLQLTQAGSYLLELGQQLLPRLQEADATLRAFGEGRRGRLRIGMECHPCYEWLLTVVQPYLRRWPDVDLDVIQKFRFNGLEALTQHRIDILITSDPVFSSDLCHTPVFDYELMLVAAQENALAGGGAITPERLSQTRLIHFPVARERLDVFTHFLSPAGLEPVHQQEVEAMEIMLQLVAANRGVCTLPDWLAERYRDSHPIATRRLGEEGVHKTLYLVYRQADAGIDYLADFVGYGR
ncbi:LysR family transcriptional regulator [Halovibrio salipaludis]|uniref:HTH-type transcriptional regulator MetR n=1 Tax=Halovibrio salipaludis TaxID=2032626 RepID=A0A2A2FA44_9GAMM|nr:LysR family transcriptional regulator [Halovibrio salipaludis]PAU82306.1 LysR family transcriptional regulator [Halovibrio salipaludis]